jgi:hypothetical protein
MPAKKKKKTAKPASSAKKSSAKKSSAKSAAKTKAAAMKSSLPGVLGAPRTGDLRVFLETKIAAYAKLAPNKRGHVVYRGNEMLADTAQMLSARDADLAVFAAQCMPVVARDLDYLAVIAAAVEELGDAHKRERAVAIADVSAAAKSAMNDVLAAHHVLEVRGHANHLPASLFTLRYARTSPATLHRAADHVVSATRNLLAKFDDPAYAKGLLATLEATNAKLGEVAGLRSDNKAVASADTLRRDALYTTLLAALETLSHWGLAMSAQNGAAHERWRLSHTYSHGAHAAHGPASGAQPAA